MPDYKQVAGSGNNNCVINIYVGGVLLATGAGTSVSKAKTKATLTALGILQEQPGPR